MVLSLPYSLEACVLGRAVKWLPDHMRPISFDEIVVA